MSARISLLWRGTAPRVMTIGALLALASGCSGSSSTGPATGEASLVPWARISGRLAYSRYCGLNCSTLFLADGATRQVRTVYTSGPDVIGINGLAWMSAGRIGYYGAPMIPFGPLTIYTIDPGGGAPTAIEAGAFPTWSVSGHLAANAGDNLLSVDGKVYSTITCTSTRAAWTPDGSHLIVSNSNSLAQAGFYLQSVTDTASRVLLLSTTGVANFYDPVVSPDGLHVAFTVFTNAGGMSIWIMGIDGTGAIALTTGPGDYEPSWSPDGKQIAFIRANHVFVMNADGADQAQVTKNPANSVSWGP